MMLETSLNVTRLWICSFCAPSFASVSAFSFPLIPQIAGIHWSTALFTMVLRDWREAVRVFVSLFREFCNAWSQMIYISGTCVP